MIVAVKNLVAERARFVLSVVGVAVAVILVLVMSGIFVGTTNQVTTYIDHSKGAVWVVQPGVSQMSGPSRGFRRRAKTGC
ncbi:Probable ABC transporter%2C permease protein [Mycobacteroides abscessus]|nr:Probable ABC transporter%2C permease protein [Mycobacteroides abscessus]